MTDARADSVAVDTSRTAKAMSDLLWGVEGGRARQAERFGRESCTNGQSSRSSFSAIQVLATAEVRFGLMVGSEAVAWGQFELEVPELAAFGRRRLDAGPAYLATTRTGGSPRVHPINPKVHRGHLALYMFPTSPKGADLRRDPRYALHATVDDVTGTGGEFALRGVAQVVDDHDSLGRELADGGLPAQDGYVRFELLIRAVLIGTYEQGSNLPRLQRWQAT